MKTLWLLAPVCAAFLYPYLKTEPLYLEWLTVGLLIYTLFLSVVVHEVCHGLAAYVCGDSTAKDAGRLTLNPLRHVSVVGTMIVPLLLALFKAPMVLGWAKPVPFTPLRLRQHPRDQVFLAVAGPLSNFVLSYLCFTLYLLIGLVFNQLFPESPIYFDFNLLSPLVFENVPFEPVWFVLFEILSIGMMVNVVLGVFNLIPFPPLDGSWILKALLPKKAVLWFGKLQMYGFLLFLAAVYFGLLRVFLYPVVFVIGMYYGIAQSVLAP